MGNAILVLGARNLGGAILDHFLARGWEGAAVARSGSLQKPQEFRGTIDQPISRRKFVNGKTFPPEAVARQADRHR